MRRVTRRIGQVLLLIVAAYLFPKLVLFYLACGLYDVLRNDERTLDTLQRYFLGNGWFVWLLSPINILLDLLSLPYINKGVYRLEDLPPGHQAEIARLIKSARRQDLIGKLQQIALAEERAMFFFKWYGTNVETAANVPEFYEDYEYVTTIGVSVFNRRQSTSKHFGPLRISLRVLYNINDMTDDSTYIVVGNTTQYWREDKLFIFDDTLLHQSFNESDRVRYCLFIDIVRPTLIPSIFKAVIVAVGKLMSQSANRIFYSHWKVFKSPKAS
ncbi:MAG TPA: aspartyl/asparaginyl beta-hydroxylase domain-containing protein [Roseiarcus sp.]|nr:aspartyl/asparaginyl beta-hydroxylase domain-containing protein [Roseiarcus sp.]